MGRSWLAGASELPRLALDRQYVARTLCAADGGCDGGQMVSAVPGVTHARPPAVAVFGLRRSGRTGNGDSPCGRVAPACQPGRLVHTDSGPR
jgi:hypothetical protein